MCGRQMYRDLEARCWIRSALAFRCSQIGVPRSSLQPSVALHARRRCSCVPRRFLLCNQGLPCGLCPALLLGLANEEICHRDPVTEAAGAVDVDPWRICGSLFVCSNSHKLWHATLAAARASCPIPHHHPALRKHPSSHRFPRPNRKNAHAAAPNPAPAGQPLTLSCPKRVPPRPPSG